MGLFDFLKKEPKQNKHLGGISITVNATAPKPPTQAEIDAEVIPVETRTKNIIANKQGLYPHEILVLDYAHTFYTSGNSFQGFWWYNYGVRNVQAVLESLVHRGFLQVGDMQSALDKQTASAIKEVLKSHGCKQTGKKAELVQRALNEIPADELNRLFPKRTYQPTELGKAVLSDDSYVPYIHRHSFEGLDIWSMNQLMNTEPHTSFRDKIWSYLNKCSIKHFSEQNFGLYRNCRFSMAQFLKEESKYKDSLAMLSEVVFYDLSGATNNYDPQFLEIYAGGFFPYENSLAATAPGIIAEIVDCQKKLGYSDEELKAALSERMNKLSTPIQLFSIDECIKIVFMERDGDKDGLTRIYAKARQAFKQKYPNIKV